MEIRELKQLITAAARPTAGVNFGDAQSAAKNAIKAHFGLDDISLRDVRRYGGEIFALIDEVVEELLPELLEPRIGMFAEMKTYGRDEIVKFIVRGVGKNRIARGIVPGARGGLYRARRLDDREFMLPTKVHTVGYQITLEELLSGRRTIAELVEIIARGFEEIVYMEVIAAVRAAKTAAPAANITTGNGINDANLRGLVRVVSAYGRPVILAFQSEAEKFVNVVGASSAYTPNIPTEDLSEIRNQGMISVYYGTPVVVLPNYLKDETNAEWVFEETDIFVLPVDEKPVKVAFKGDLYTAEVPQPHGGMEYHAHRIMGVGVLFYNHVAVYTDLGDAIGS